MDLAWIRTDKLPTGSAVNHIILAFRREVILGICVWVPAGIECFLVVLVCITYIMRHKSGDKALIEMPARILLQAVV
jgi:hypothetical protein